MVEQTEADTLIWRFWSRKQVENKRIQGNDKQINKVIGNLDKTINLDAHFMSKKTLKDDVLANELKNIRLEN